jgi:hypothetical protein
VLGNARDAAASACRTTADERRIVDAMSVVPKVDRLTLSEALMKELTD